MGVLLRDPALPNLRGRHLYGDFCDPTIRSLRFVRGRVVDEGPIGVGVPLLSSFGLDAAGRVYAISLGGAMYRLEPR
jgi:hypothetical protein